MSRREAPFFVGYLPVPKHLQGFLLIATAALIALGAVLSLAIGASKDDPGPGTFRFDLGRQTVTGVIERTPIPILHVTEGNDRIPTGHTLMLSGPGKNGVMGREAAVHGQRVAASGILLERGSLDMMQVAGGADGLVALDGAGAVPQAEDLGRWRLAGEICDGKCLAGAMRPGRGLAHKACANLCVAGGVPPVFVSSQPVHGSEFLMIAGPDGGPLPDVVYDRMAEYISVAGQITRHGDLLVFALEPDSVEPLP